MPRFETEDRFWEIEQDGRRLRMRAGRIGEPGDQIIRTSPYEVEAAKELEARIAAKLAEGFVRVERPGVEILEPDPGLIEAVTACLDPERLSTVEGNAALSTAWSVLGDWLSAHGDVRGELIGIDEAMPLADDSGRNRLLTRRDQLLDEWVPKWFGELSRLDGIGRPIHLGWDHGWVAVSRVGTEPGSLHLARYRMGLRDLVPVLDKLLCHPLTIWLRQLRIAELDPRGRRDLTRALEVLRSASRAALLRLELGDVAPGQWVRDETGNYRQRLALARIGSLAQLSRVSEWAPRLCALRIVGSELRVCPPLPQLRVLELQTDVYDEELRRWLVEGPWPKLERLWLRSTRLRDPWSAVREGAGIGELLASLEHKSIRELGLQGPAALLALVSYASDHPLELDELRLARLGDAEADALIDAHSALEGVDRLVIEEGHFNQRWRDVVVRYGARLHLTEQTFGLVGEGVGDDVRESIFDAPGWS